MSPHDALTLAFDAAASHKDVQLGGGGAKVLEYLDANLIDDVHGVDFALKYMAPRRSRIHIPSLVSPSEKVG